MPVTRSNPILDFFFLPIFSPQFSRFSRNEKGEHYFIVHFDEFYTALFSHNTCSLSFYKNMTKKSAESIKCKRKQAKQQAKKNKNKKNSKNSSIR